MGYRGAEHISDYSRGGLVFIDNYDSILPHHMVYPSRNINLNRGGREPRGGTAIKYDGYGGAEVMGKFDFIKNNGNQFLVVVTADGKIWKDASTTLKTGLSANIKPSFEVLNDTLYITLGSSDVPQTWDGAAASTSDWAHPHSDWASLSSYPIHMEVHGRGESERLWAFTELGYAYYSDLNDGTEADFTAGAFGKIYIETGSSTLVGGVTFTDRLFVFSDTQAYVIDDSNTDHTKWGYNKAPWNKGAAHHRLIIDTPYGPIVVTRQFEIYPVSVTDAYGDFKIDDMTEEAEIYRYVDEHVDLTKINSCHGTWDPKIKGIKIFYVRNGLSTVDSCLVFFVDRAKKFSERGLSGPAESWMIHDNQANASGYSASSSCIRKVAEGDYQVHTGGYDGKVWGLEETTKADNSLGYYAGFRTPRDSYVSLARELLDYIKDYKRGKIRNQPSGSFTLNVAIWIGGEYMGAIALSVTGTGAVFGTAVYGTDKFATQAIKSEAFKLGYKGSDIQLEFYRTGAGEDFFIPGLITHFKALGVRPS